MKILLETILLSLISFSLNAQTKIEKKYFDNGQVESSIELDYSGRPNGRQLIFDVSGRLLYLGRITTESTLNGPPRIIKSGNVKRYNENGTLIFEGWIDHNGELRNEFRSYFPSGKLEQEGEFKNGNFDRQLRVYDENGNLKKLIWYDNGKRDGRSIVFHTNGTMYIEASYSDDKLMEILQQKDQLGNDLKRGSLTNGNGTFNEYNEDGMLLETYQIKEGKVIQ